MWPTWFTCSVCRIPATSPARPSISMAVCSCLELLRKVEEGDDDASWRTVAGANIALARRQGRLLLLSHCLRSLSRERTLQEDLGAQGQCRLAVARQLRRSGRRLAAHGHVRSLSDQGHHRRQRARGGEMA